VLEEKNEKLELLVIVGPELTAIRIRLGGVIVISVDEPSTDSRS